MHFQFLGVNEAFPAMVEGIHDGSIPTARRPSRNGDVLVIEQPVTVTYRNPQQHVLFNRARDCNPFFHLFEALWMLAGRNDVAPLVRYNSQISEYSDDGWSLYGAYGHRWRVRFGFDQLLQISRDLHRDPHSRREVLQMWGANCDLGRTGKDLPCNTQAVFQVQDGKLRMDVYNRSNDLIWGMLGANVVHFSILQEYMAARIGVGIGPYHQITSNLHTYVERWKPEKWLADDSYNPYAHPQDGLCKVPPLVEDPDRFDRECRGFIDNVDWTRNWDEPFLQHVASPMCWAFELHKRRHYKAALKAIDDVTADDWRTAGKNWIIKRQRLWEKRNVQAGKSEEPQRST